MNEKKNRKEKVRDIALEYLEREYTIKIYDDENDEAPLILRDRYDVFLVSDKKYISEYEIDKKDKIVWIYVK
jgi:hypothetical protein